MGNFVLVIGFFCTNTSTFSLKPKTFKMERLSGNEFVFNGDVTLYKNIQQLIAAYNNSDGAIYLQECLPPSEYGNKYITYTLKMWFLPHFL